MFIGLLRLPPLVTLVIALAIVGFVLSLIVSSGSVQIPEIIALAVCGYALVRVAFHMRSKPSNRSPARS
jgi:hypothetical protein